MDNNPLVNYPYNVSLNFSRLRVLKQHSHYRQTRTLYLKNITRGRLEDELLNLPLILLRFLRLYNTCEDCVHS